MAISEIDRTIVGDILSGNIDAFEVIVARYKGLVFHVVRSIITDASAHEDLAQDIFVRVYETLPRFQFRCGLATWISRIACNTCLNRLRRARSHPQDNPEYTDEEDRGAGVELVGFVDSVPGNYQTPENVICRKEIEIKVRDAVARLPVQYRLMITLHYLEGFSIPEMADSLGMPRGTVKSHLYRARAMLKDHLLQKLSIEDLL